MEREPKKFIVRLLEFCGIFALSAFLIRLGVCYIMQIWPVLLILAILAIAGIIGYRVWKHRTQW